MKPLTETLKITLAMLAVLTIFSVGAVLLAILGVVTLVLFAAFISIQYFQNKRLESRIEPKKNETYLVHSYFGIIEQNRLAKIEKSDYSKNLLFINRCHSLEDLNEAATRIDIFQAVYGKNDKYWDLMSEHYAAVVMYVGV